MAKNKAEEQTQDLPKGAEEQEIKATKAEDFVEKNRQLVTYVGGAIAGLIVLIWFGFNYYEDTNEEAQVEMFQAQFYFERDSFNLALNGDGANLGFVDIANEYSWTKAGNLAKFYAGVCYMQTGQFEDAIDQLEGFSGGDWILDARAKSLIGDAYMELENPSSAISAYQNAVNTQETKDFTPVYLMKLALAHETLSNWSAAAEAYDRIIKDYPNSTVIQDAKRFKARAEVESQRSNS